MVSHHAAVKNHRKVPASATPAVHHLCNRISPCRVYCGKERGIEYYYHINRGSVRVSAFLPHSVVGLHRAALTEKGRTFWGRVELRESARTLSLSIPVSPENPESGAIDSSGEERSKLIDEAVKAMEELYRRVDEAIPFQGQR